jgi:hypothetical protein
MYHRYFKARAGSPVHKKIVELNTWREKNGKVVRAFMKKHGITQMYGTSPLNYRFDFDRASDADAQKWAKTRVVRGTYYFVPRKNTTEGKELLAEMKALPPVPSLQDALQTIPGLQVNFPCVIDGGCGYRPFIKFWTKKSSLLIVSVPWKDVDAKKLAAYERQAKSKKRHSWDMSMDHALWQAPTWLKEIKEWEALKLIEEAKA